MQKFSPYASTSRIQAIRSVARPGMFPVLFLFINLLLWWLWLLLSSSLSLHESHHHSQSSTVTDNEVLPLPRAVCIFDLFHHLVKVRVICHPAPASPLPHVTRLAAAAHPIPRQYPPLSVPLTLPPLPHLRRSILVSMTNAGGGRDESAWVAVA